jgi:hypothetical protein
LDGERDSDLFVLAVGSSFIEVFIGFKKYQCADQAIFGIKNKKYRSEQANIIGAHG